VPVHTGVVPVIVPGVPGAELTVILFVFAELVPQVPVAVTLKVPLDVGTNVAPVVVPLGVPPPLYVHV
jgi:hypothetical protein